MCNANTCARQKPVIIFLRSTRRTWPLSHARIYIPYHCLVFLWCKKATERRKDCGKMVHISMDGTYKFAHFARVPLVFLYLTQETLWLRSSVCCSVSGQPMSGWIFLNFPTGAHEGCIQVWHGILLLRFSTPGSDNWYPVEKSVQRLIASCGTLTLAESSMAPRMVWTRVPVAVQTPWAQGMQRCIGLPTGFFHFLP